MFQITSNLADLFTSSRQCGITSNVSIDAIAVLNQFLELDSDQKRNIDEWKIG